MQLLVVLNPHMLVRELEQLKLLVRSARGHQSTTFDAGHLRSRLLGGKGGLANTFPQWSSMNRGLFRDFEGRLARLVRSSSVNDQILFSVQPQYKSPTASVPDQVSYQVRINGTTVVRALFSNQPGQSYVTYVSF